MWLVLGGVAFVAALRVGHSQRALQRLIGRRAFADPSPVDEHSPPRSWGLRRATLRSAIAAHLARYKGHTRVHAESDLRSFLTACERQGLELLGASRPQCRAVPPLDAGGLLLQALDRVASVVDRAGFYRTCAPLFGRSRTIAA